ncbi:2-amino-4-hydroxy-6-hydroxymethyldihydropteridine diphosphokinase [Priestia megaterium]|nr:2-amino-4-hydroxy-6-hydroxymethyldihydropteridine diphosphokinase [Priestia megaterium]
MEKTSFIALGSNIEDRMSYLEKGISCLNDHEQIKVVSMSSVYETAPVGYTEQADFLNMVVEIRTTLSPLDLLDYLQEVERKQGRKREIVWGPRTLDLDILLYNEENIKSERLVIPHPHMTERAFVMVPLCEIADDLIIPTISKSVADLTAKLPDRHEVNVVHDRYFV